MKTTLLFLITALAAQAAQNIDGTFTGQDWREADGVILKKDPPMEVAAPQPVLPAKKRHHRRRNVIIGVAAVAVGVTITIHWGKGHKPKASVATFANGGTSK